MIVRESCSFNWFDGFLTSPQNVAQCDAASARYALATADKFISLGLKDLGYECKSPYLPVQSPSSTILRVRLCY